MYTVAVIVIVLLLYSIRSSPKSPSGNASKAAPEPSFRSTLRGPHYINTNMEAEFIRMLFDRYWIIRTPGISAQITQADANGEDLVSLAIKAVRESDMQQVKTLLNMAVSENCTDARFYQVLADLYYTKPVLDRYGIYNLDYFLVLNKLIELVPSNMQYLLGRADYCRHFQRYDAAITDYRKLMDLFPEDLWFPYILSKIYRKQNKKKNAVACLNSIVIKAPAIQMTLMNKVCTGHDFEVNSKLILSNDRVSMIAKMLLMKSVPALPDNIAA